jgi:hypothetical protein
MRLQLTLLASLLPMLALAADGNVATKVQIYADTDQTVVVSPHARISGTLDTGTSLEATYTEDIVSSASVDVRSTASPRIQDVRQEEDASVAQVLGTTTLAGAFIHASERDYDSFGGSLGVETELFQRNTTLALRGGYTYNLVGKADDPGWKAPFTSLSLDAAWTQTFTPTTIGQLAATWEHQSGFLASPYRRVSVANGQYVLPEATPPVRDRIAAAVGFKQYLGIGALHLEYRFYFDTFFIFSHTPEIRYTFDLGPVNIRLRYRFYVQTAAFFYKAHYDSLVAYLSADREMSPFSSHLFGVKLDWSPPRLFKRAQLKFDLKVEGMYFSYSDFPALKERWALNSQVGASVEF